MFESIKNWWAGVRGKFHTAVAEQKEAKQEKRDVEQPLAVQAVQEDYWETFRAPAEDRRVPNPGHGHQYEVKEPEPAEVQITPVVETPKAPVKAKPKAKPTNSKKPSPAKAPAASKKPAAKKAPAKQKAKK